MNNWVKEMPQSFRSINYRIGAKNDIPQLMTMVNAQYVKKKDLAYFEWQFFNSFYPTICVVAEKERKIIGMFGLQRRALNDDTPVGHLIDLLVDKNWRGRGIFEAMGEMALNHWKDIEVFTVLPNPSGKIASEKALGLKTIAKIDDWVLKDPSNFKKVAAQSEKIPPRHRYQTNQPYFHWRFETNPTYNYEKIIVAGCGFVYTKRFTDPVTNDAFTDIVDYHLEKPDMGLLVSLWNQVVGQMVSQNRKNISTWVLPHTPLKNILQSMGFEPMPRERYFCIKTKNPSFKYLSDITVWDLVQADAEIY